MYAKYKCKKYDLCTCECGREKKMLMHNMLLLKGTFQNQQKRLLSVVQKEKKSSIT